MYRKKEHAFLLFSDIFISANAAVINSEREKEKISILDLTFFIQAHK